MVRSRIEELPREKLFVVMRNIAAVLSFWGVKYELLMMEKLGENVFQERYFSQIAWEATQREAQGLMRSSIISTSGIDAVLEAIEYSHWALFESIELTKLTQNGIRFRTTDYSTQRFVARLGMECYPCRNVGLSGRSGFVKAIDPNATVQCVFCPP